MAEITWTRESEVWLKDIFDYIAADDPGAAARTVIAIYEKAQLLRMFGKNPKLLDLTFAVYNQWGASLRRQLASSPASAPQRGFHAGKSVAAGVFLGLHDCVMQPSKSRSV